MARTTGIFKHTEILDERPSAKDILNYSDERQRVKLRVERIITSGHSKIVAYLGNFGVGKSTVLEGVHTLVGAKYSWVVFETWRYSNRDELWAHFAAKVIATMSGRDEINVLDEFDGTLNADEKKQAKELIVWSLAAGLILFWCVWYANQHAVISSAAWIFILDAFKYLSPILIALLTLLGLGNMLLPKIFQRSPITRALQYEDRLIKEITASQKPVIVIVEDVDRAGADGLVFMETMKHFKDKVASSSMGQVVIIAPQSLKAFDAEDRNNAKPFEHSLKVYDEKIYFDSRITDKAVEQLYEELGVNREDRGRLTAVTKILLASNRRQMSMRMLKHALREVEQFMDTNVNANPALVLLYALGQHLSTNRHGSMSLGVRSLDGRNEIFTRDDGMLFAAIFAAIGKDPAQADRLRLEFSHDITHDQVVLDQTFGARWVITLQDCYQRLII